MKKRNAKKKKIYGTFFHGVMSSIALMNIHVCRNQTMVRGWVMATNIHSYVSHASTHGEFNINLARSIFRARDMRNICTGFWLKKDITKGLFIFVTSSSAGREGLPRSFSRLCALSWTRRQVETPKMKRFCCSHDNKDKITWRNVIVYILGYKPCSYTIKFYAKQEECHLRGIIDKVEMECS